jgi:hypothetical protein
MNISRSIINMIAHPTEMAEIGKVPGISMAGVVRFHWDKA